MIIRYDSGEHYYDGSCEERCECRAGEFSCQPVTCEPGLQRRGTIDPEVRQLMAGKQDQHSNKIS